MILPAPARLHMRIGAARAQECAGQVGVEHAPPLIEREILRRLADVDPRVVDQNVQPAAPCDRFTDHRVDRFLVGHVHADGEGIGAERLELANRRTRLLRVARRDDDACPGLGETAGHAQSDPAIAAGDDGDPAAQVEQAAHLILSMWVRNWIVRPPAARPL